MQQTKKIILIWDFKLIKSKLINKYKTISHGFFNKLGGHSSGIYRSLNCGAGSKDKKMFDTLQSIKNHKKNFLLENIYKADVTHLINFDFFIKKIKNLEIDSINLTTQREFLLKMGILERAEIISKNMPFSKKSDIYFRLKRLIDKNQMGTLFKVLFATNKKNNFNLGF